MAVRKPRTLRRVRYTVRGSGSFPFDMLRYDRSFFACAEDEQWAEGREPRELMLELYLDYDVPASALAKVKDGVWQNQEHFTIPCVGRWHSFGWAVTEVYPIEHIPLEEIPNYRLPMRLR
jgi:hypothetical protein